MTPLWIESRIGCAEYARLRALVDLRLAELQKALDGHEQEHRDEHELLAGVEAELAKILARLDQPSGSLKEGDLESTGRVVRRPCRQCQ